MIRGLEVTNFRDEALMDGGKKFRDDIMILGLEVRNLEMMS